VFCTKFRLLLQTTGCGLPPGPGGALGGLEGISYLAIVGIVGWSLYTKVSQTSPKGKSRSIAMSLLKSKEPTTCKKPVHCGKVICSKLMSIHTCGTGTTSRVDQAYVKTSSSSPSEVRGSSGSSIAAI
jgi:hypothetical protein